MFCAEEEGEGRRREEVVGGEDCGVAFGVAAAVGLGVGVGAVGVGVGAGVALGVAPGVGEGGGAGGRGSVDDGPAGSGRRERAAAFAGSRGPAGPAGRGDEQVLVGRRVHGGRGRGGEVTATVL